MGKQEQSEWLWSCLRPLDLTAGHSLPLMEVFEIAHRIGITASELETALQDASAHGWLTISSDMLYLTKSGYQLLQTESDAPPSTR